ncbi:DUF2786 domain-containing protein [Bdellovibrionota bacterium FG-2]
MQAVYEWERGVLQELYREYRSLLYRRRIDMRPTAIALFDSETHWGCWEPLTRTIRLSKNLIQNHSWFQVLGIFRHEMAHQWVDECFVQGRSKSLPHGEAFRLGCRMMGVPEEFSGASANLKINALDWRQEKGDETTEKLLEKVKKLLALATSNNEHEALLAMNKVRELYAKYNLEQAAEQGLQGAKSRFAHILICHGKKRIEAHQDKIIGILVGHFFVQVLTFSQFDAASSERHRAIEIIGTRENALMAEYVYHFLMHQTDFWVREATKVNKQRLSRLRRKSYRLGILEGFIEKLEQAERPTEQETAIVGTAIVGTAIAKFKKDPHLAEYISQIYQRITTKITSWQGIDNSSFYAGHAVGKTLTLNKAVETKQGNLGRYLTHDLE